MLYEEHGTTSLLILSDDGTLKVDGRPAKEHPNPELRTFRCFKTILEGQAPAIPGQPTRKVPDEF